MYLKTYSRGSVENFADAQPMGFKMLAVSVEGAAFP